MNLSRPHPFKRIFFFDHGLGHLPGHWVHLHQLLVEQSRKFGLEATIYGNVNIKRELIGDLPAAPLFHIDPGTGFYPEIRENHRLRNEAFLKDLNQLDPSAYTAADLFVFTYVENYELHAILAFSSRFTGKQKPVFVILLQFDNGLSLPDIPDLPLVTRFDRWLRGLTKSQNTRGTGLVASLYRNSLAAIRHKSGWKKIVFMAPFGGLDALFSQTLGRIVHPFFMHGPPASLLKPEDTEPARYNPERKELTVCFLGHSSTRKGLQFLPSIIASVRSGHPEVNFEIHVNYNSDYAFAHLFDGLFDKPMDGVTCYHGHLDDSAYFSILRRSHIALMPYDSEVYRNMPSGFMIEAIAAGKVLVIPDRTSLARQAKELDAAAVVFEDFSAESAAKALLAAIIHYGTLREKALAAARHWSEVGYHDMFMQQLLDRAAEASTQ
jgi:glycosyltransferase involved in cell wall biosynthesis